MPKDIQPWKRVIVLLKESLKKLEGSHSGLVRTLGKRVWSNPPGVRISYPPPIQNINFEFEKYLKSGSGRAFSKKHFV